MDTINDINVEWIQADERPEGRGDPCWYVFQSTSDPVCAVANTVKTIYVCAEGEMRIYVLDDKGEEIGIIRYADDLPEWGITNDVQLEQFVFAQDYKPFVTQFGRTVTFVLDSNCWFDLYDREGNELDSVSFDLAEAIGTATELLLTPEWQSYGSIV